MDTVISCNVGDRPGIRVTPMHFTLEKQKHTSGPSLIPRLMWWLSCWARAEHRMVEGRPGCECAQAAGHSVLLCLWPPLASWASTAFASGAPFSHHCFREKAIRMQFSMWGAVKVCGSTNRRDQLVRAFKAELSASSTLGSWALGWASEVVSWPAVRYWRFSLSGWAKTLLVSTHPRHASSGQTQLYLKTIQVRTAQAGLMKGLY